jgi:hypothetical protein
MGAEMADGLAGWHRVVRENDPAALDALLDEAAVFLSPIVHTPQVGRAKAGLYLRTALALLNNGAFRYVGEWRAPGSAVLEFEGLIDGITINGVDMIWWNEAGLITRFKVMVRPLKAINLMHQAMGAMLAAAGA